MQLAKKAPKIIEEAPAVKLIRLVAAFDFRFEEYTSSDCSIWRSLMSLMVFALTWV